MHACPHVYNNTCELRSLDSSDSYMHGMPYIVQVNASNKLGWIVSKDHTAYSAMIGMLCVMFLCISAAIITFTICKMQVIFTHDSRMLHAF